MLNPVTDAFVADLRARLPAAVFRELTPAYLEEPRGRFRGQGGLLLAPGRVEEAAEIVRACATARVGIVPYGGGTGLVGGQIMETGPAPVIVTLDRMRAIRAVHADENVLVAEAGCILAEVQAAAEAAGRLFPLSLASEGSARIGGLLSTNAGGLNVLRYGNARDLCLGIEAVLPDGSILKGLKRLRKDNTGYDLRHLLIGAEGTLGLITAAALKLAPRPAATGAALLAVRDPGAALALLAMARDRVGEGVSAFELIHRAGLDFLAETMPDLRRPFADPPDWMVLIELGLGAGQDPGAALEDLFAGAFEAGLVSDGLVAQSEAQRQDFWTMRETIPLANRRIGAIASHDIALPLSAIPDFIAAAGPALARIGRFRINCFGHLGDGNLHYNVFPLPGETRADHEAQRDAITRCVHDLVAGFEGSISAEHGIGRLKVAELGRYGDPARLAAMRAIKAVLDPAGILNPGAVIPPP
ncbi:FAD-binding oxidoreductase [Rhodovulum sulfidophilum]|uniref:FAD-binding oxidoreductase n=1 Tax=Rhodovulum sulfidophilum TaxID=35806 RepID=UPI00138A3555|nr:FAD-binding oxidoreductase [Rhodovulum sulfidophilum]NDK33602.1 FAD-binding oxidoreductase [Rhodovulum sulfidophilum]